MTSELGSPTKTDTRVEQVDVRGPRFAAWLTTVVLVITLIASTLSLAADFCPKRAEGFAFAALMSVLNLSSALSNNLGSFLYEHAFHNQLAPLIIVSAGSTALILVFVPLLRLGDKPTGVAAS